MTNRTQWPQRCPVWSRCQCIGCASAGEAGWLWFGTWTPNLHFPSTFFAIYLKWTIVEPGWCLSLFFCNWMFSNFSVLLSKITFDCYIFLFWLPLHSNCFAWLLQYWSSSCAVSNSAEGGDVKSKSCLLFMINDQNFLMSVSCIYQNPLLFEKNANNTSQNLSKLGKYLNMNLDPHNFRLAHQE